MSVFVLSVKNDKRIEASLERLRAMGLRCYLDTEDDNTAFIFIPIDDIAKIIRKRITYPTVKVYREEDYLVIKCWREYAK